MSRKVLFMSAMMLTIVGCGDSRVIDPPPTVNFTCMLDAVVPPQMIDTLGFREVTPGAIHAHLSNTATSESGAIFISGKAKDLDLNVTGSFIGVRAVGNSSFGQTSLNIDVELRPETELLVGFQVTDTVYFRAYPISGSVIEYTYDKDGKLTYANYGEGSNVLSFVLK
jgi:hypothetical protein